MIPEWIEYEQEIEPLVSLVQNNTAKEVVQEIEIDTDGEQEEQNKKVMMMILFTMNCNCQSHME